MILLVDTDFLSSFLKIDALETVRDFYRTDGLVMTSGVYQELSRTALVTKLDRMEWITTRAVSEAKLAACREVEGFERLGRGEQETIALANRLQATMLTSDQRALRFARNKGIEAIDIPGFLLACRQSGFLSVRRIAEIIQALKDKDRYEFKEEMKKLLL